MFCVMFVHRAGGSKSCTGDSVEAVRALAAETSERFPKSYVLATVPYECPFGDTSLPREIRDSLGAEMLKLYGIVED